MNDAMTKRKPSSSGSPKVNQYNVKLDTDLQDALTEYLGDQRPRTTSAEVFRVALEDYLQTHGYWPRKTKDESD